MRGRGTLGLSDTMSNERKIIYVLLCCGSVTISFSVAAVAAAIPAISSGLKLSDILVSRIIPAYMIPYGVGALIYAPLTKQVSFKQILGVSLAVFVLASFFCAGVTTIGPFLLGRTAMGLGGASVIPLGLILIGQLFERNVRGRLVGMFFSSSFIASIAGILVAGFCDWRWLFVIPGILGTLTVIGILLFKSEAFDKVHGVHVDYIQIFRNARIREIFIFIFVISFLYHAVHKWFGVYFDRVYHMDKLAISLFFILMSIAGAAGQMLGGYVSDKKGRYAACAGGVALLSLGTMALVGTYPLIILAVVVMVVTTGWTIGHNGVSTVLTDFPDDDRPAIASLNSSVRFVAGGIGFFASSAFVAQSFGLTFLGIGILMFLTVFFLRRITTISP